MLTIIEIHSGEAVCDEGGPVLFSTFDEAAGWAIDHFGLAAGREYRIELVSA